jgi:hypothetical protein
VDGGEITLVVNAMETSLSFAIEAATARRTLFPEGPTLSEIALEAAREIVLIKGYNRFHAAEIFHKALEKHPGIKRNSFMSRIVACTPDHPSNKHFASRRDYFLYGGNGILMLNKEYMAEKNAVNTPFQSQ